MAQKDDFLNILKSQCAELSLNDRLLASIVTIESSWNPWAIRYERNFTYLKDPAKYSNFCHITTDTEVIMQKCSFGLMQIMGGTARNIGFTGPLVMLLDPINNFAWGCLLFKKISAEYLDPKNQIAAWNAGSVKRNKDGTFFNQEYVDKVWREYTR